MPMSFRLYLKPLLILFPVGCHALVAFHQEQFNPIAISGMLSLAFKLACLKGEGWRKYFFNAVLGRIS